MGYPIPEVYLASHTVDFAKASKTLRAVERQRSEAEIAHTCFDKIKQYLTSL